MTQKEKAINKYVRDKHSTDECHAYIKGWEDAEHNYIIPQMYLVLALGMILGSIITVAISLI